MSATLAGFAFHDVADDPRTSGFQRPAAQAYHLGTAAFAAHLDAIAAAGARPALARAVDWDAPGFHVALTFDDGGRSALAAAQMLERRGWLGHFFIVTDRIGAPAFLDAAGIRALHAAGHAVGSHSHTHPDIFRDLSAARQVAEWCTSCDRVAQILGEPCDTASIPGGDASPTVFAIAAAAGIRVLFTSEPRIAPRLVDGCRVLGRFVPKVTTSPARVGRLAAGRGWSRALAARRLRIAATGAIPALYRAYVRFRTRPLPEAPDA